MYIIQSLKEYLTINKLDFRSSKHRIGLKLFHVGILLLAAAPSISFLLLTISSIFGSLNRKENYFFDNYNIPFLLASILMIINCVLITSKQN